MMTDCKNCELKDYCIPDECIWYDPDEEQSSDEVKEFEFWFNR